MGTAHSAFEVGTEYESVRKVTAQLAYLFILFFPHVMTWRPCVAMNLRNIHAAKHSLILLLLICVLQR